MFERITTWTDPARNVVQVSVAWLSDAWDPLGEVTEQVGPFDDVEPWIDHCRHVLGDLGVGQLELEV